MPNRFTNPDKWSDKQFKVLPAIAKLIYVYMYENCDNAGFFQIDIYDLMRVFEQSEENIKYSINSILAVFNGDDNCLIFPEDLQNNLELSPISSPQLTLNQGLEPVDKSELSTDSKGQLRVNQGLAKGQPRVSQGLAKGWLTLSQGLEMYRPELFQELLKGNATVKKVIFYSSTKEWIWLKDYIIKQGKYPVSLNPHGRSIIKLFANHFDKFESIEIFSFEEMIGKQDPKNPDEDTILKAKEYFRDHITALGKDSSFLFNFHNPTTTELSTDSNPQLTLSQPLANPRLTLSQPSNNNNNNNNNSVVVNEVYKGGVGGSENNDVCYSVFSNPSFIKAPSRLHDWNSHLNFSQTYLSEALNLNTHLEAALSGVNISDSEYTAVLRGQEGLISAIAGIHTFLQGDVVRNTGSYLRDTKKGLSGEGKEGYDVVNAVTAAKEFLESEIRTHQARNQNALAQESVQREVEQETKKHKVRTYWLDMYKSLPKEKQMEIEASVDREIKVQRPDVLKYKDSDVAFKREVFKTARNDCLSACTERFLSLGNDKVSSVKNIVTLDNLRR